MRFRLVVLGSLAALVAVSIAVGAAATTTAVPALQGMIGPGFTISLKAHGKRVTTLKHGKYKFVVRDQADIHNFTLNGPAVSNKTITGTGFVGTKTVTVTLKKGMYKYYCTVHPEITGTFKVT
jgi:plastocyanin